MSPSCFICLGLAAIASARALTVDDVHFNGGNRVPESRISSSGLGIEVETASVLLIVDSPCSDGASCSRSAASNDDECVMTSGLAYAEGEQGPPGRNCTSHGDHSHCTGKDGTKETCERDEEGVWMCHGEGPGSPCIVHVGHTHGDCSGHCDHIDVGYYDLKLHQVAVIAVLIASFLGAVLPIMASQQLSRPLIRWSTFVCKHFGTGIILSTAFVHLLYHAFVMLENPCLSEIGFEPAAAALALAGVLLVFFSDYAVKRWAHARSARAIVQHEEAGPSVESESSSRASSTASGSSSVGYGTFSRRSSTSATTIRSIGKASAQRSEGTAASAESSYALIYCAEMDYVWPQAHFDVYMLEGGIIFHSVMIGVSLGATGGEQWKPFFIAIVFHQFFEGLALGTRISALAWRSHHWWRKWAMASAFGVITPIGIAIGISFHASYNPNSPTALLVTGVFDALSAGVLMYAGIVELLVQDFMHGELAQADCWRVGAAITSLLGGTVCMSVLGKWA